MTPLSKEQKQFERSERDWPEDFSHENGNYHNQCGNCGLTFYGHKRRVRCKLCMIDKAFKDTDGPKLLSKEVQEQIRKEAEERYPMHSADAINAKPDMEDRRTMYKVNSHVMMARSGYIAGATLYASQLAEKDARIKELEKEVERLRREIGEVALAGLALGNKANQGNG